MVYCWYGARDLKIRVHVMLRSYSGSPEQQRAEAATMVLAGKRVLVLAASEANREIFAKLLPTVNATVSCIGVAQDSNALPAAVTAELLVESTDIVIADLSLVPALQALQASRTTTTTTTKAPCMVIVPLTTSLQYENDAD